MVTTDLTFKIVADHPESFDQDIKIDMAMYPTDSQARDAFDTVRDAADTPSDIARTAWAWITAGVEVKSDNTYSAFYFDDREGKPLLRDTVEGIKAQAQLAKYAAQLMLRQHRTFVFILYISHHHARLTRWDRTGCVVSSPIDIRQEPHHILNFVYRLARMTPAERGHDSTVVFPGDEEMKKFKQYTPVNTYAAEWARDILDNTKFYPIYKVCRSHAHNLLWLTWFRL